jgi:hypothetical protein
MKDITDHLMAASERLVELHHDLQTGAVSADSEVIALLICVDNFLAEAAAAHAAIEDGLFHGEFADSH